jgi:hypothetical protein
LSAITEYANVAGSTTSAAFLNTDVENNTFNNWSGEAVTIHEDEIGAIATYPLVSYIFNNTINQTTIPATQGIEYQL